MEKKFILTDKFVINSFGIKLFQIINGTDITMYINTS